MLSDYFAVRCYFAASVLLLLLLGRRHYASSSQHPVPNKISFNIHVIDLQRERVERERSKKNLLSCSSFSPISHSVPRQLSVLFYHPWVFHGEVSNCTSLSSSILSSLWPSGSNECKLRKTYWKTYQRSIPTQVNRSQGAAKKYQLSIVNIFRIGTAPIFDDFINSHWKTTKCSSLKTKSIFLTIFFFSNSFRMTWGCRSSATKVHITNSSGYNVGIALHWSSPWSSSHPRHPFKWIK